MSAILRKVPRALLAPAAQQQCVRAMARVPEVSGVYKVDKGGKQNHEVMEDSRYNLMEQVRAIVDCRRRRSPERGGAFHLLPFGVLSERARLCAGKRTTSPTNQRKAFCRVVRISDFPAHV